MKGITQTYPPGWDEKRVLKVLAHYENQSEDEAVCEDEAGFECEGQECLSRHLRSCVNPSPCERRRNVDNCRNH